MSDHEGAKAQDGVNSMRSQSGTLERAVGAERTATRAPRMFDDELSRKDLTHMLAESLQEQALIVLNPSGWLRSWNVGAQQLFGYGTEEVLEQSFSCLLAPEHLADGLPQRLLLQSEERGSVTGECWYARKTGTRFWGKYQLTTLRDHQDGIQGFALSIRDVSEQKRILYSLRFVNDTATLLARLPDQRAVLHALATVPVPVLCDACLVYRVEAGVLAGVVHPEQHAQPLPISEKPSYQEALRTVLRTGQAKFERWREIVPPAGQQGWEREAQPHSYLVIPIMRARQIVALLVLFSQAPDRQYGLLDLAVGENLARMASTALDTLVAATSRRRYQS